MTAMVTDPGGREAIERAFAAALDAVEPRKAVLRACRRQVDRVVLPDGKSVAIGEYERLIVVGAGKAAAGMAAAVGELFGEVASSAVVTRDGYAGPASGRDVWEAGHPLPDVRSMAAATEASRLMRTARPADLVVCVLSGGASALWAAPPKGVPLGALRALTQALLRSGAPIQEANVVRKHVSRIAGGQLARDCGAGRLITLAISDVIGASHSAIGSGPTLPDPSTFQDAIEILERYGVVVPTEVRSHLACGAAGRVAETPKPGTRIRPVTSFHVVASVVDAVEAAGGFLAGVGYSPTIVTRELQGEAREVGAEVADAALAVRGRPGFRRALIWGGETTVTIRGSGRGGRCQEAALAAAIRLSGDERVTIAFLATDGTDGSTNAAGACVDGGTVARGGRSGLSAGAALDANDSFPFLSAAGDLVATGATGTNVNDLAIALID
jgi:glycerate 2-kinase